MVPLTIIFFLACQAISTTGQISDSDYPWTYTCKTDTMDGPACQREHVLNNSTVKVPLKICILVCGTYGPLWPYPKRVTHGATVSNFSSSQLSLGSVTVPNNPELVAMVNTAFQIFQSYIPVKVPSRFEERPDNSGTVVVNLNISAPDTKMKLGIDESYFLKITSTQNQATVTIQAPTFFGARHALESLSQLIEFNIETWIFQIVNNIEIEDAPAFKYRGAMLDTSRNFIPFSDIKRLIDGMSHNKLNIFHWHITDSNSFPFYSKRVPAMTIYGSFASDKVYLPDDITEFLNYANQRGIKVIPELDAPSHAGNGWQFGEDAGIGELSLCVNAEPYWDYCIQPPCGQLNPINENMYGILGQLYGDMLDVFDRDIFHMGGDEVSLTCWMSSEDIRNWLTENNSTDLMDLWGIYQRKAFEELKKANNNSEIIPIVWTSEMTGRGRQYIPPDDYVIQVWSESGDMEVDFLFKEGYRVILSSNDTVYLDHGYGPWRGRRHTVTRRSWHDLYSQDLISQIEAISGKEVAEEMYATGRLFGGEACMFAEKVDAHNMDMKIWPRVSAYAERLWSNPRGGYNETTRLAYPRLIHQRDTMVLRGIGADALLPESCYYTTGFCDRYDSNFADTGTTTEKTGGAGKIEVSGVIMVMLICAVELFRFE